MSGSAGENREAGKHTFQFAACQHKQCVSLEGRERWSRRRRGPVRASTAAVHGNISIIKSSVQSCTSKSEHQPRLFFYRKTVY